MKINNITKNIQSKFKEKFVEAKIYRKAGNENWKVVLFIFILELSATFDLAGDFYLLWAMI